MTREANPDLVERLRDAAREIEIDGTPSQVGLTAGECLEAAAHIEKLERELAAATERASSKGTG